jgi:hypothetical protein
MVVAAMAVLVSTVSARSPSGTAPVLATAARTVATAHIASAPAAGRMLGGFTSQSWPLVLAIAKNGKRIVVAVTGLVITCASGDTYPLEDGWAQLPISASGHVHATRAIAPMAGSSVSLTGGFDSFAGRLNRARSTFSGVWQLHLSLKQSGGQSDQCDSGRVALVAEL